MNKTLLLLLTTLILCGARPTRGNAAQAPEAATLKPAEKLIDGPQIMSGFLTSQTVRVMVNLAPPAEPLRAQPDWNDKPKLRHWQGRVKARQDEVLATMARHELRIRRQFENQPAFSAEVTQHGLSKLMNNPRVLSIEPVRHLKAHLRQGLPLMNAQGTRATFDGTGIAIAIVDTGVDYTHPQLGAGGFPNSKVIGGIDVGDDDNDPRPNGNSHGTACAGIAAGNLGSVGDYIGGVAPNAKIYAVKISPGSTGSASTDDMVAAWNWCVTHRNDDPANPIMVISTSFGGGRHFSACNGLVAAMTTAAENAVTAGITILASSGNEGYCDAMEWPACISSVISVGAVYDAPAGRFTSCVTAESCAPKTAGNCSTGFHATDDAQPDRVTSYSNTSSFLDLLAPAEPTYTTDIRGAAGDSAGDYMSGFNGTSAACPYAAGAAAALQCAAKARLGRFLSPSEVRATLIATGDRTTDPKAPGITKPRVNLGRAIESLGATQPPPSGVVTLQNNVPATGLAGATGEAHLFKISVPSGQPSLSVRTAGGQGDCDLYIKRGQAPTSSADADARSEGFDTAESVTLPNPPAADYYIAVVAYSNYAGVTLTASFGQPTATNSMLAVRISTPVDGQSYSSLAQASGTASGEGLANVIVMLARLNSSNTVSAIYDSELQQWGTNVVYQRAAGTTSWSINLPPASALPAGRYAVLAKAADFVFDRVSQPALATFTVSGPTNPPPLPSSPAVAGAYHGLFSVEGSAAHESSGAFNLIITASRAFTGRLVAAGKRYAISGTLAADGTASLSINRPTFSPLSVRLAILPTDGAPMLTGSVSSAGWEASLTAYRVGTNAAELAALAGRYTLHLPGNQDGFDAPGGDGYSAIAVDARGNIRLSGALGDGVLLTQANRVLADGYWPFYVSLYGGRGFAGGWLRLTADGVRTVEGFVHWERPAFAGSRVYPQGFTLDADVIGSAYVPRGAAPALELQTATLAVEGPNFPEPVVLDVRQGANNRLINTANNATVLTINPATGLFRGTVRHPGTGQPVAIKGAVNQDQNAASGFFLDANQSGPVVLSE